MLIPFNQVGFSMYCVQWWNHIVFLTLYLFSYLGEKKKEKKRFRPLNYFLLKDGLIVLDEELYSKRLNEHSHSKMIKSG